MPNMIRFSDAASIGKTKKTKEGYLIATSRVARTGVQNYLAAELGDAAEGFKPDDVVRVYRHEDQVFHKDTLASLTRVPVTLNHPKELVDSDNWKDLAVGEVGDDVLRDGEWIVVNPMIKDAAALEAARSTHKEISMGYTANIVPARDGVDADFEMVDIRMNHLALVPKGRAGSQARIGDAATWGACPVTVEDEKMTVETKAVILGDKQVEVLAKDADTVAAILKDHKAQIDAKDAEIVKLTKERDDALAKVLSDEDLKKLVDAKIKSDADRAKVLEILKDEAKVAAMSDEAIAGALAVLGDAKVDDSVRDALKDHKPERDSDYEKRIKDAQAKFLNLENK